MTEPHETMAAPTAGAGPEAWCLWEDSARSPAENMAVDEALLSEADPAGPPVVRFYSWDRPAVSIGYIQAIAAAPVAGYAVVRRPTGGGVVYHDGDLTYSVVVPARHRVAALSRLETYRQINKAIQAGLGLAGASSDLATTTIPGTVDRLRMVCFEQPTRYDILSDGKKIAGSAQRRTREGVLHQGSIRLDRLGHLTPGQLRDSLRRGFEQTLNVAFTPFRPGPHLQEQIARLTEERYACRAWNRRR